MMSADRQLTREWLDDLPADDPRAVQSRRDLAFVNALMLQPRIMARALFANALAAPRTIADLGTGDGTFMLRVAALLAPHWRDVTIILVDRHNTVSQSTRDGFAALRWSTRVITSDLLDVLEDGRLPTLDIVTANLFLHHFSQQQLTRVFERASSLTRLFVACEPRRTAFPYWASRCLWAVGCNDVSRHDAVVSVLAGFAGHELSAIWPQRDRWELHEQAAWPFTHRFVARRADQHV